MSLRGQVSDDIFHLELYTCCLLGYDDVKIMKEAQLTLVLLV